MEDKSGRDGNFLSSSLGTSSKAGHFTTIRVEWSLEISVKTSYISIAILNIHIVRSLTRYLLIMKIYNRYRLKPNS